MKNEQLEKEEVRKVELVLNVLLPKLFDEIQDLLRDGKPTKLALTESFGETEYALEVVFNKRFKKKKMGVDIRLKVKDNETLHGKNHQLLIHASKEPDDLFKIKVSVNSTPFYFDYYEIESLVELDMMLEREPFNYNVLYEMEAEHEIKKAIIDYYLDRRQFDELHLLLNE